jgi:hypothetical protein
MNRMVPSNFIILNALVFTGVLIFEETIRELVLEGSEVSLELKGVFFRGKTVGRKGLVLLETTHC